MLKMGSNSFQVQCAIEARKSAITKAAKLQIYLGGIIICLS